MSCSASASSLWIGSTGFWAVFRVGESVWAVWAPRTGPVQRDERRDVVERRRLHRPHERAHGATVELEHTQGLAALQQVVGRLVVVEVEVLEHHGLVAVGP